MFGRRLRRKSPVSRTDITVLIPTYEMQGLGAQFLERALSSVIEQKVESTLGLISMEIVVIDHSRTHEIKKVCEHANLESAIPIAYVSNPRARGSASANLNEGFNYSTGDIVKILFQDDFLSTSSAICNVVISMKQNPQIQWLVSGSNHTRDGDTVFSPIAPRYHRWIHLGLNTISSPSVVAVKREAWLDFDERLKWLMDVDWYKSLASKHGQPLIFPDVLVTNGIGLHQVTNSSISRTRIFFETVYVALKHLWTRDKC